MSQKPVTQRAAAEKVVIPAPIDQNPLAQSRMPKEMMRQGWSASLFRASQQWATTYAEAIAEAATRPTMRFVALKSRHSSTGRRCTEYGRDW